MPPKNLPRAVVFIDGNNWYFALKEAGAVDIGRLSYPKISEKLTGPGRMWIGTRYYIGAMPQQFNATSYAAQRSFLAALTNSDKRISVHLGRLETRTSKNLAARELAQYMANLRQP